MTHFVTDRAWEGLVFISSPWDRHVTYWQKGLGTRAMFKLQILKVMGSMTLVLQFVTVELSSDKDTNNRDSTSSCIFN